MKTKIKRIFPLTVLSLCIVSSTAFAAVPPPSGPPPLPAGVTIGDNDLGAFVKAMGNTGPTPGTYVVNTTEGSVIMYVSAVLGPHSTNTAAFVPWATAQADQMYASGDPTNRLGFKLIPPYISMPGDMSGSTLWYTLHVVATNANSLFLVSNMRCITTSSEGSLNKVVPFDTPSFTFSQWGRGVRWNGSPRVSDTIYTTGFWNQIPVNEFIFIGVASKFFVYNDANGQQSISNYIGNFQNFTVTGKYELSSTNMMGSNIVNYANRTLTKQGIVMSPIMFIGNLSPGAIFLGMNANTNDTWILEQSILGGPWTDSASMNAGDIFFRAADAPSRKLGAEWRVRLQQ